MSTDATKLETGAVKQDGFPSALSTPTAIVHLEYDVSNPPPVPSSRWTRFICISDTHTREFPVPGGDVLLHAGDLTNTGKLPEFRKTVEWLRGLPHPLKILIAGNHDLSLDRHNDWYDMYFKRWHVFQENIDEIRKLLVGKESRDARLVYLEDEKYEFQTKKSGKKWSVYGSPWTPEFYNWGFNYNRGVEADQLVAKFPEVDILMTHGPPHNILDMTVDGSRVGCESLAARLSTLRPRLHLFGHIHEDHGAVIRHWSDETQAEAPTHDSHAEVDTMTVHVNAANWPAGPRARGIPMGFSFGRGSFQPVIVDLLDETEP